MRRRTWQALYQNGAKSLLDHAEQQTYSTLYGHDHKLKTILQ